MNDNTTDTLELLKTARQRIEELIAEREALISTLRRELNGIIQKILLG